MSITSSLGGFEESGALTICDDKVEEVFELCEPLALLDLAITIGVETAEDLIDLGVLCGLIAAGGEALASERQKLGPIELSVAVDV